MWTVSLAVQAVAWLALMCLSPFIFVYLRKVVTYLAYRLLPRDMLLEYEQEGHVVQAFYIRRSFFGVKEVRTIQDLDELDRLRGLQ